ncbi:MAG: PAS domain S-box protein, partial [Rhizobiaceae bacterium]|nr:PAS domain S-box protein [Rhizobiaceae bacterium]
AGEDHDPFKGETPALAMDETPERRESDKVIRLAERRSQQAPKGLSSAEQETFQEIGKRLKDASTEDDVEAADSTGPGEATENDAATEVESGASTAAEPLGLVASETVETDGETQQPSDDAEATTGSDDVLPDETPESADEDAEQVEAVTSDEAGAAVDQTAPDAVEATGDTDTVAEASDVSAHDETAAVDVADLQGGKAVAEAEETQTGETDASAVASSDAEVDAPAEVAAGEDAENEGLNGEVVADEDDVVAASADEAETADEASQVEDTVDDWVEPAEIAATDETAPEPATSEPAKSEPESTKKPKVGLSAFLPSAFSGGGTIDASIGIDSTVLSRLPLPLLIHSGDELHYANREFLNLTGYRSLAEFDLAGGMDAIFAGTYEADGTNGQTLRLRARDGSEFPVHAFLQSVGWQGGKALLLALRRADAPEAPRAADVDPGDLEARLAELRTIIDTATDGVVIIDNDGTIRSVSKPAEALFGYNGPDLTGRSFASLFAIESQRPAREYLDGLAGNGVASVLNDGREVIGREAQGRFIPLFMTIGRLPQDSGFCAVLRDITHWKRAEEELTEARAAAERASSQKTEFLARVSHEIRTPLNAIIGFSELMIDEKFGPIGSERYRDYLNDINRSGNHVLDLVNDLL